jgi:GT2 family glycosyltransferase
LNFPSVAIVILNFNGRNYLEKFLPSVFASTYPNKKIIVADNASTDDSVAYLASDFKEAGIIQLDKNYGFAEGYNQALSKVESEYYILLNSDVEVIPGWIEDMITMMEADKTIAA